MKESEMLKKWVREQMDEACKHRDKEGKILGKVYEKVKKETQDELKKEKEMENKK